MNSSSTANSVTMKKRDFSNECNGCSSEDSWILHNVSLRGTYSRFCTSCVLKLHAGSFCPICFEVYEASVLPVERVVCSRCPSVSHSACVTKEKKEKEKNSSSSSSFHICPPCLNPSFVYFDTKKKSRGEGGGVGTDGRLIDLNMAKVLLAAAKIASISMNKAANIARMEAEKRVKEANVARQKAKEALLLVSAFPSKGKETMVAERKSVDKFGRSNGFAVAAGVQELIENHNSLEKDDNFGVFGGGSSTVGLIEEKLGALQVPSGLKQEHINGVSVELRDQLGKSATPVMGRHLQQNSVTNAMNGGKENGLSSLGPASVALQHSQNNTVTENVGKSNASRDSDIRPPVSGSIQDGAVTKSNEGVCMEGSVNAAS